MLTDPATGQPVALCVMGPTAAGKTALALALCEHFDCEIVSVDSAQIYRGMDIGTAKPDAEILRRVPHHLIDIRDPAEPYSAAEFRHDAVEAIEQVLAAGKTPLLVGGSMLYFRVLREGLSDLPAADRRIRDEIEALAAAKGWQAVHEQLAAVDPLAARRIHPNDPQRLQRALEVYRLSGRSLSSLQAQISAAATLPCRLLQLSVGPLDRAALHARIAERFDAMLADGLVDEVRRLYARDDLNSALPSIRCVGYRQIWDFLSERLSYADMRERAIIATRQLAKRQLTWLRSWPDLHRIHADDVGGGASGTAEEFVGAALKIVRAATTSGVGEMR